MDYSIYCKGCAYYRPLSNRSGHGRDLHACHYMLDTGLMRERKGAACLSFSPKRKVRRNKFAIPVPQR